MGGGDAALALTGLSWLIVNSVLLALAGFGDVQYDMPSNPYRDEGLNVTTGQRTVNRIVCIGATAAGAIAGGAGGALLGFGVGAVAGAAIGGAFIGSLIGCEEVQQLALRAIGLVELIFDYFGFLFQLLLFSVPGIPGFVNLIIVGPPAAMLAFVGLKTIRGAGG